MPTEIVAHLMATCKDVPVEEVGDDVEAFLQALRPGGFVGQALEKNDQFYGEPPARQEPPLESDLALATDKEERASFYRGGSMSGTSRPGDRLTTGISSLTLCSTVPQNTVLAS